MKRGTTLPELVLVLLFLSLGTSATLSVVRSVADLVAVRSAREAALVEAHRARTEARQTGAAALRVSEAGWVRVEGAAGEVLSELDLEGRGVEVEIGGSRSEAELRYGARGTATFAAATITFRRRAAESRLVISAQGRVRR